MTGPRAHIDFETRSTVNLKKAGVYAYAMHETTGIWCLGWRIDHGPVAVWEPGEPFPDELFYHVRNFQPVVIHNAMFDRVIWNFVLRRALPQLPEMTIAQTDCTMARALAVGLPGSLEVLTLALKVSALGTTFLDKDMEGHALMMRMSRPRSVDKTTGEITWWTDRERVERLKTYCARDVEVESQVDASIPTLTVDERRLWEFDQLINERGVEFDALAATRMIDVTEHMKKRAGDQLRQVTGGAVRKITDVLKLAAWLNERGIACTGVGKGAMADLKLEASAVNDIDAILALAIREANGKTSAAKLQAGLDCSSWGGRMRGLLQYHGTTTSRWAGRLFQPHNIKRLGDEEDLVKAERLIEIASTANSAESAAAAIEREIGPVMPWVSKSLRPLIKAATGNKFVGGDYSNVEGRMNAWYAGERWKLQAFRDFDAGTGPDLYKLAYAKSFAIELALVVKWMRQIGKVEELALGFQGGPGAFVDMGKNYGVRADDLVKAMRDVGTFEERAIVAEQLKRERNLKGMTKEQWFAAKLIVNAWRKANPAIVAGWWEIQDAAIEAVANPGVVVPCYGGKAKYAVFDGVLWCQVASGKMIAYQKPSLRVREEEYIDKNGELKTRQRRTVFYWAYDGMTRKWKEFNLYGGLQCENIISKTSRDLLADSMELVEAAGYPVVLTVHDEIVSEVAKEFGSAQHFESLMRILPGYMGSDFPMAVAAWEGPRYGK